MTKTKSISLVNNKIDKMIITGETHNEEYKRLIKLHYQLTK